MRHTRRELLATTLTVLATSGLSCGGGGDEAPDGLTPPTHDCLSNGAEGAIGGANQAHRHTMRVSKEDVRAGVERTYEVGSPGNHPHSVTLTADHFASLQANQPVSVGTTTFIAASGFAHTHVAMVSCS